MAIVLENTGSFGDSFAGSSGQMSGILAFIPTVGNKLLMALSHAQENTVITKVAQTGVVWTRVAEKTKDEIQTLGVRASLWHGDVVATASKTITIDVTTGIFGDSMAVVVHELSGLRDVWPFEYAASHNGQASPIASSSGGLNVSDDAYQFAAACGADSSAGSAPSAPSNGFTAREEVIGTDANPNVGHRCSTADKIVSAQTLAGTTWAYSNFTRWVGLVGHWAGDTEQAPINLVQEANNSTVGAISVVVTMGSNIVSTNTLLLAVAIQGTKTVQSVTQSGATWTKDAELTHSSNSVRVEIWRSSDYPDAADSITVQLNSPTAFCVSVQEYSGVLKTSIPVDVSATNQGTNDTMATGSTGAIAADDELIFAAFAHTNIASHVIQEAFGFLRNHSIFSSVAGSSWMQNRTRESVDYQVSAKSYASGDWCGAIVAYKNQLTVEAPGPALTVHSAERNQSGTTDVISASFDACEIPSGTFTDGNRYLIIASARGDSFNGQIGFELRTAQAGAGVGFDTSFQRPYAPLGSPRNESWGAMRVRAMANTDYLVLRSIYGGGNNGTLRQCNLVAIDLDGLNFYEGRDWWYDENTTLITDMDSVFANNIGARLRFDADGSSTYLVIGHARLSATAATGVTTEMAMQLWDETNSAELAKCGWQKWVTSGSIRQICMNTMAVLTPSAGEQDLQIRCVGGGVDEWRHEESMLFVMRLDQLLSWGYDQDLALGETSPGDEMPPSQYLPQAAFVLRPDVLGEMITVAFTQADNSADDDDGIASQARFPWLDGGDRSILDTENATLGNTVVDAETNCGSSAGGSVVTRIPTFGVSKRDGVDPLDGTVEWYNGGISSNGSVIDRVSIVSFGRYTQPIPSQEPAPTPLPAPTGESPLSEKPDGTHEFEALDNLLEQFKP